MENNKCASMMENTDGRSDLEVQDINTRRSGSSQSSTWEVITLSDSDYVSPVDNWPCTPTRDSEVSNSVLFSL